MARTYLDHAASSPPTAAARAAVAEALGLANPSSVHLDGQRARAAVETARTAIARELGVDDACVTFTSGGTEADNLALRGRAWSVAPGGRAHLVVSRVEHDAVHRTACWLEGRGEARVSWIDADDQGRIAPPAIAGAIEDATALVALIAVGHEVGTLQPVAEAAAACRARGVALHVDAVQAAGRVDVAALARHADLLALSPHKVGGPRGVGVLVVREGVRLEPVLTGGMQERGLRAGTEDVAAIAGGAVALVAALREQPGRAARLAGLTARLEEGVRDLAGAVVNGAGAARAPGLSSLSFEGVAADLLLQALDLEGFAVSTGSACASGTLLPSRVLLAMGLPAGRVLSTIRVSLDPRNTEPEIDAFLAALRRVLPRLRGTLAEPSRG